MSATSDPKRVVDGSAYDVARPGDSISTGGDEVSYAGDDFPGWDLVDEEWSP